MLIEFEASQIALYAGYNIAIYTGSETFRTNAPASLHTDLYVLSKGNLGECWNGEPFDGISFYGGCINHIYHGSALHSEDDFFGGDKIVLSIKNNSIQFNIRRLP